MCQIPNRADNQEIFDVAQNDVWWVRTADCSLCVFVISACVYVKSRRNVPQGFPFVDGARITHRASLCGRLPIPRISDPTCLLVRWRLTGEENSQDSTFIETRSWLDSNRYAGRMELPVVVLLPPVPSSIINQPCSSSRIFLQKNKVYSVFFPGRERYYSIFQYYYFKNVSKF